MGAAAALAPRLLPAMSAPEASGSLDALARTKGLRFGTALGARSVANATLTTLIKSQCGVIVPENELKMPSLQPSPGTFRFDCAGARLSGSHTQLPAGEHARALGPDGQPHLAAGADAAGGWDAETAYTV